MTKTTLQQTWSEIESWLKEHAPEILENLNPGAKASQIQSAAKKMKVEFPKDLSDSFKLHNGQSEPILRLMDDWQLLPLANSAAQWKINQDVLKEGSFGDNKAEAKGPLKPLWWNPKWIPVAGNGGGDLVCADTDPPEKGAAGQIVIFWHTSEKREVIAASFADWLEDYAKDLKAGKYKLSGKNLVKKGA